MANYLDAITNSLIRGGYQTLGGFGDLASMIGLGWGDNLSEAMSGYAADYPVLGNYSYDIWNRPEQLQDPEWYANFVPSLVPQLAATVIPYAGVSRLLTAGGAGARMAGLGGIAAGGAVGGGLEAGQDYRTLINQGIEEDEARQRALVGMPGYMALNALPLARAVGGGTLARRIGGTALAEGLTEWAEEPYSALVTGRDPVQAAKEGIAALPLGAIGGAGMGAIGPVISPSAPTQRRPEWALDTPSLLSRRSVYHGTTLDIPYGFSELRAMGDPEVVLPDQLLGPHAAFDERIANRFAQGIYGRKPPGTKPQGFVHKAELEDQYLKKIPQERYEDGGLESDQHAIAKDINREFFNRKEAKPTFVDWAMRARRQTKDGASSLFDELLSGKQGRIRPADFVNNFDTMLHWATPADKVRAVNHYKKVLSRQGFMGVRYTNTSPEETQGLTEAESESAILFPDMYGGPAVPAELKKAYSIGQRPTVGRRADELRTTVSQAIGSKNLAALERAGNIKLIEDPRTELDAEKVLELEKDHGDLSTLQGFYDRGTDTSYLVAGNIEPGQELGVFMHEVGVHQGLHNLLGARNYGRLQNDVQRLIQQGDASALAAAQRVPKNTPEAAVPEEVIAYLVEQGAQTQQTQNLVRRFMGWLQQALYRMGIRMPVNQQMLGALAKASVSKQARQRKAQRGAKLPPIETDQPATAASIFRRRGRQPRPEGEPDAARSFLQAEPAQRSHYGFINQMINRDVRNEMNLRGEVQYPELIHEQKRGRIPIDEQQRLADVLGEDVEFVRKNITEAKKGTVLNAEGVRVAVDKLEGQAVHLNNIEDDYIRKIEAGTASLADDYAYYRELTIFGQLQARVSGIASELGRALGTLSHIQRQIETAGPEKPRIVSPGQQPPARAGGRIVLPSGEPALGGVVTGEVSTPFPTGQVEEFLQQAAGGPANIRRAARARQAIRAHGRRGAANRWARQLGEPGAFDKIFELWVNNLLSGPATHVVNTLSNTLVALNEDVVRFVAAFIPGRDGVTLREAFAGVTATLRGLFRGAGGAAQVLWNEDFVAQNLPQYNQTMVHEATTQRAIKGFKGRLARMPGRALNSEDLFFKVYNAEKEIARLIARRAGRNRQLRQTLLANPPQDILEQAWAVAQKATFTNPLGPIGRALMSAMSKHPGSTGIQRFAKFIFPFVRTPVNIVKYAGKHSFMAPVMQEFREAMQQGDPAAKQLAIARMTWGSSMMGLAAYLASQGLITGGGPDDPKERQLLRAQGWEPYAGKIGDKYYSYGRLEPIGILFGVSADLNTIVEHATEGEVEEIAALLFNSIAKNLTHKTFLRGASDVVHAMAHPEQYGDKWLRSFAGTVVPTGIAQWARVEDPGLKRVESIMEQIKSRMPHTVSQVRPRLDFWGRPIVREGGVGPDIMSPIYTSTAVHDEATNWVKEVFDKTGYAPGRLKNIIETVEITPDMHNEYIAMARGHAKRVIDRLAGSAVRQMGGEHQARLLKQIFDNTAETARRQMFAKYRDWFLEQQLQQRLKEAS